MMRFAAHVACVAHVALCDMAYVFLRAACCAPCRMLRYVPPRRTALHIAYQVRPRILRYVLYVENRVPGVALSVARRVGCRALR